MQEVNHRKNIVKAYHQEVHRLKRLKKDKPLNQAEWDLLQENIAISESRIQLLKELQQPLKEYYSI